MNIAIPLHRTAFPSTHLNETTKPEFPKFQHSSRFAELPNSHACLRNVSLTTPPPLPPTTSSSPRLRIQPSSSRARVSSDDAARLNSSPEEEEEGTTPTSSFAEFITSERVKVVAMLGLALALCNADRVVMSVAIVPLSLSRGWSRSFSGIVQVVSVWLLRNWYFVR